MYSQVTIPKDLYVFVIIFSLVHSFSMILAQKGIYVYKKYILFHNQVPDIYSQVTKTFEYLQGNIFVHEKSRLR